MKSDKFGGIQLRNSAEKPHSEPLAFVPCLWNVRTIPCKNLYHVRGTSMLCLWIGHGVCFTQHTHNDLSILQIPHAKQRKILNDPIVANCSLAVPRWNKMAGWLQETITIDTM